jgi:hypothetical protein
MTAETRAEIEWLGGRKSGDGELGDPPPPPKSPLNERGNRGDGRRRWQARRGRWALVARIALGADAGEEVPGGGAGGTRLYLALVLPRKSPRRPSVGIRVVGRGIAWV